MGFNELKISEGSITVGITDLVNSFFNAKEFFGISLVENENKITKSLDLDSVESHKQFFGKFPINDGLYEIPIKHRFQYKKISINLNGRIDAYSKLNKTIYELKISEKNIDELVYNGSINLFKTQLFIYSYIFYKNRKEVEKLKLIIASTNKKVIKEFEYGFNEKEIYKEIKKLFPFLYDIYLFDISKSKNKKIDPIFPYKEFKPIQQDIIKNILNSQNFITFIEAPFASGKTSAVLYSVAKKYNFPQIHYFTSRNIQKNQVLDEGKRIGYKSILRKAFSESCLYSYLFCKSLDCKYYLYPTENYSILKENGCPVIYQRLFYTMYDLIIADYNYLFYRALSKTKDTICIIDEYHSFLSRISDFFTVSINKQEIEKIRHLTFTKYKKLNRYFKPLFESDEFSFEYKNIDNNDENPFTNINNRFYIDEIKTPIDSNFFETLLAVIVNIHNFIKENNKKDLSDFENEIFPFYQKLKTILELFEFDIVMSYSRISNEKIFTYKSIKSILNKLFYGYKEVIGISATLEPKQLLYHVHDSSQFSIYSINIPKKIRTYIIDKIETTFKKREKNSPIIANLLNKTIIIENKDNKLINRSVLLFFASYEFIKMIDLFIINPLFDKIVLSKDFKSNNPSLRVYNGRIDEIKDFFINDKIHLLFMPYRSIIQEGANLNFDIAGGFFVGLPFRVPDNQYLTHSILMKEYLELSNEYSNNSFEILSLFPAINDVLQSSGRIGRDKEMDNFLYFIGKEFLNRKVYDNICDCYSDLRIIRS